MADVVVRSANEGDVNALLSLYDELGEGDPARAPADPESARTVLGAILDTKYRYVCVGVLEGQVVGTAEMVIVAGLTHRGRPWAIVENVVVARAARRNGVATSLMDHLLRTAEVANCYKVQLLSGKHRLEAHHLYRSLGFESVAEGFRLYFDGTRRVPAGSGYPTHR